MWLSSKALAQMEKILMLSTVWCHILIAQTRLAEKNAFSKCSINNSSQEISPRLPLVYGLANAYSFGIQYILNYA